MSVLERGHHLVESHSSPNNTINILSPLYSMYFTIIFPNISPFIIPSFESQTCLLMLLSWLIWQCVKTLCPFCSHQNSWDLWMFIPRKMVLIGIDPYPYYHGTTPLKKSAARRMPWKPIWSWSACDSSSRQRYHFSIMVDSMGKSWKIMVVSHWISCFQWEKHWTKWFYWWNNGGFSVAMVDCSWFIGEPTMIVAIIYLPGRYGQLQFTVDVSYQMIHIIIYIYI